MGAENSASTNFQEARENAHQAYLPYEIPYDTQLAFNDPLSSNITPDTPPFWLLVAAVKAFVAASGGFLPLVGVLPDISTSAHNYVTIQRLFRAKAAADVESVKVHLRGLLKGINRPENDFKDDEIAMFCKHATCLRIIRFKSVADEYDSKKVNLGDLGVALMCQDTKAFWYLALRAAGRFQAANGRLPGDLNGDAQHDFKDLKKYADELVQELELEDGCPENYLKEMCRFGGSQIHTIGTYLGGVAAQECIKFITKQWEPFNNTFVYDGITGASGAWEL